MKLIRTTAAVAFIYASLLVSSASAACDPKVDPCAPKKEPGAWSKGLAVGFNYTSGNTDTSALSVLGAANRETTEDIIDLGFAYGYGEDRAREEVGVDKKNKDEFRAAGTYKYLLSDRVFAAGATTFLYDDISDIDYRVTLVPSMGYFLLKDADFKFAVDAGPGYVFEKVGGVENDFFSPKVGQRFDWTISCTSKFYEFSDIFFDASDSDNTLVVAEAGVEAAISSSMSLVLLIRDTFDNVPAADRERNDVSIITALKVAL